MARFASHEAYPFWQTMKEGYEYFELTRQLPTVAVCNRRYVVNVALNRGDPSRLDPEAPARHSSSPSLIPSSRSPASSSPSSASSCPARRCAAWQASRTATRSGAPVDRLDGLAGLGLGAQHELRARPVSDGPTQRPARPLMAVACAGCGSDCAVVAAVAAALSARPRWARRPGRHRDRGRALAPPGPGGLRQPLPGTPDLANLPGRLSAQGLALGAPVFIRIFKREFELELWMRRDGRFQRFAVYPICRWSGRLGPKLEEGDGQAPEGFYTVDAKALNPASRWHRSFNLGFPNAFDRAHARTGSLRHGARRLRVGRLLCHDRSRGGRDLAPGDGGAERRSEALPCARLPLPHDRGEPRPAPKSPSRRRSGATSSAATTPSRQPGCRRASGYALGATLLPRPRPPATSAMKLTTVA